MPASYLFCCTVDSPGDKVAVVVEMLLIKSSTSQELGARFAFDTHDIMKNMVVVVSPKENLSGVEFVEGTRQRPHVYLKGILTPNNWKEKMGTHTTQAKGTPSVRYINQIKATRTPSTRTAQTSKEVFGQHYTGLDPRYTRYRRRRPQQGVLVETANVECFIMAKPLFCTSITTDVNLLISGAR